MRETIPAYPKCQIWHCILVVYGIHCSIYMYTPHFPFNVEQSERYIPAEYVRMYIAEYGHKITYKTAFICYDVSEYV